MLEFLASYIELQQIDGERHAIEQQLAMYPPKLAALEERLAQLRNALVKLEDGKRAAEIEERKAEKEMAAFEDKIRKYQYQQNMVKTAKQGEALEHEIASLKEHLSGFEDRALELMTRADELSGQISAARSELEEFGRQAATERGRIEEQVKSKRHALDTLNADREQFVSRLDADQKRDYDIVAVKHPGKVVAPLNGESCGGCFTQLLPTALVDLRSGNKIVRCPHCHRFLVEKMEAGMS